MTHKTETYVVIRDNKIIRVYRTSQGMDGVRKSLAYEKITNYSDIRKYPNYFEGRTKEDIRCYSAKGKRRDEVTLVKEGLVKLQPHQKLQDNKIVEKSVKEKIDDGLITVGEHEIYDASQDKIRPKTLEEMYTPEQLAAMERERLIQEEMQRIIRAQAEANLKSKGII